MTSQAYQTRRKPEPVRAEKAQEAAAGPSLAQLQAGAMPSQEQLGRRVDLPEGIRAKMEASFGADFSGVKLYESQTVADAGAQAVAMGDRIGFAPGALDLSSTAGQALLGHELSHVVSQARGEASGRGFLQDAGLEARADREGAMAAAGESVYTGPVTPISTTSTALSAAGPMQAKKPKRKAEEQLAHIQSDGRSREGDAYFAERFGDAQNRGAMKDSHMFRLFLRQSYGKSREEKDALYDMYTNPARRGEYLEHLRSLTDQTMNMDMDQFNLKDQKSLLREGGRVHDVSRDTMALSDVIKDNQEDLGYSDQFVNEHFAARRQYLMATESEVRGRLREITGEAEKGSTAQSTNSQISFGETGKNQGFQDYKERYIKANRERNKQEAGRKYNAISMAHYQAATPEQRAAGKAYIQDSRDLNGMLRGIAPVSGEKQEQLQKMSDDLSGMMQTTQSDQKSYRGISDAGLLPLLAQAGMEDVIKPNGTVDHQKLMAQKDRLIGMTYQDKGFGSTTASQQFALEWGGKLPGRDLNFFKKRALDRHGVTEEERNAEENKGLFDLVEGPEAQTMQVQMKQRIYGALADNILQGDEVVNESDIGSHLMEIALPKGTKAAYIDSLNSREGQLSDRSLPLQQLEVLLDKGARFRIKDILPQQDEHGQALPNQFRIMMELLQEEAEEEGVQPAVQEAAPAPQPEAAPVPQTPVQAPAPAPQAPAAENGPVDVDSMTPSQRKAYMIRKLNGMG